MGAAANAAGRARSNDLFRPEALRAQQDAWLGDIHLATPPRRWIVVGLALLFTAHRRLSVPGRVHAPRNGAGHLGAGGGPAQSQRPAIWRRARGVRACRPECPRRSAAVGDRWLGRQRCAGLGRDGRDRAATRRAAVGVWSGDPACRDTRRAEPVAHRLGTAAARLAAG